MTALTDRIADVLRAHKPYEAIDGNLYCRNRDCRPATAEDAEAWVWAAHMAERIAAELHLAEETKYLEDGAGGISTNYKTGETTGYFKPATKVHRWVSGWAPVGEAP